ncbi:acyl-CoA dehydrogenase family protein [Mycolicibacterium pulveris]|nr:acyl-CoA dehydrogenase family protein [Mycolicibacterium pulveris]
MALLPEELALRDKAREVIATDVAPYAAATDLTGEFPHKQYRALVDAGLGALPIPVSDGGLGASSAAYAVVMEEIAAACGSTSLVYMTQMHAAWPIIRWGTPEQRAKHVPRLCVGDIYGSIAISEPSGGSDVSALSTTAQPVEEGFVLNGTKTFITSGDVAGVIVTFATIDRSAGRDGVVAFLVDPADGGVVAGAPFAKMGMHGSSTVELSFQDCVVPRSAVLGDVGKGFAIAMSSVVKTRLSAAAQGVGLAAAALRAGIAYAAERDLLHPKNDAGQFIQSELALLRAKVLSARLLLIQTARVIDAGKGTEVAEVSAAKLLCTELAVEVADRILELMGPDGDRRESAIQRLLRDALVTRIYDGTNEIQRLLIARDTYSRGRRT